MAEDLCNPVAIFEPDLVNAGKAFRLAPESTLFRNLDDLYDSNPDGIVVSSPNSLHASQCINALRRGIPVFCQKPLGRDGEETRQVISEAYVSNRHLGVDLSYRYTDGMQKIYNNFRNDLGKIYAVDLVFNNAYGPDKEWYYNRKIAGGGCLLDLGIHLVDLALWMLDFPGIRSTVSEMYAKGSLIERNVITCEDYISAQIVTDNDTLIRLVCSWNLPAGQDAEIKAAFYGTEKAALFYNVNGSFYDFETVICSGTSREVISSPPEEWGAKALIKWVKELQDDIHFRKESFLFYNAAEVIDRVYNKIPAVKPIWYESADVH